MSKDIEIARINDSLVQPLKPNLLPLAIQRNSNFEGWLASRSIDVHRTNSRLLRKVLRLTTTDEIELALKFNAATITDNYWFKPKDSDLNYENIRFKENYFDTLALRGDPNGFSLQPSRTPELTNIGSFEKCWRLIDGKWWMYKSGNTNEYFSELFIDKLGENIGMDMAHYEMDDQYIRAINFVDTTTLNYEPISGIMGDDDDYDHCFMALYKLSDDLARQYLKLIWMDTICLNMDRHTENFGVLRLVDDGSIIKLAPNFDNNIALISRGYPNDVERKQDGMIRFFIDFIQSNCIALNMYRNMVLPCITPNIIQTCLNDIPIKVNEPFIIDFIMSGYTIVTNHIHQG